MIFKLLVFFFSTINYLNCDESLKIGGKDSDFKESKDELGMMKIVGGQIMEIEGAPYLAQLRYHGFKGFYGWTLCGGSIISSLWIASAAHCLPEGNTNASFYEVRTGSSRKSRGGTITKVELLIPHAEFNLTGDLNFDIALIKLANKIMFTDRQRPIKLASANKVIPDFTEVMACGFGDTNNTMESTEFLRAVIVKTVNRDECSKSFNVITVNMICATVDEGGKAICQVKDLNRNFLIIIFNNLFFSKGDSGLKIVLSLISSKNIKKHKNRWPA